MVTIGRSCHKIYVHFTVVFVLTNGRILLDQIEGFMILNWYENIYRNIFFHIRKILDLPVENTK